MPTEDDMLRDNKEDGFSPGSMLHLWTAQTDAVLDCIRENGFSQVKMEFIDRKYEESAWVFKEAYGFFKQRAGLLVKPPEGAESPIWLFFRPELGVFVPGQFSAGAVHSQGTSGPV